MNNTTTALRANKSTHEVQPKLSLSSLIESANYHLAQLASGDRDEDHADLLIWNVRAYERTRQGVMDGKLPVHLADHAGDTLSELLMAIDGEADQDDLEQRVKRGWIPRPA